MPDPGGAPGIYASRPKLVLDGTEEPGLAQQLVSLFVEESTAGLYRCEATFANWGPKNGGVTFLYFDRETLEFGRELRIEMGAGDGAGLVFDGRITALEGRFMASRPPEILVLAEDRLQDLRMTRRTRTFEDVTDGDVLRRIASAHGLRADINVEGPTHRVVAQVNQSDLAFARERARAAGAELWLEDGALKAAPRPDRSAGSLRLTLGAGLLELVVSADLAEQASGFRVAGWDVTAKEGVSHRASAGLLAAEINGGVSGSAVLEAALGEREQQVVHALAANEAQARSLAEAMYARTARRFVVGNGLAEGDARLRVGAELDLRQVGPLFEGRYRVTRVRHTFDGTDGYRTAFTVERASLGRAA